jgi:hypothetical protein
VCSFGYGDFKFGRGSQRLELCEEEDKNWVTIEIDVIK